MRIVQCSDSFLPIIDGVGRVVYNYANLLAERGHETYVVAPMADTGYRGGYPFELVDYNGLGLRNSRYKLGLPFTDTHFLHRITKIDLDVVHAHSPVAAGQFAIVLAKRRGIPLVGTFHSKYREDIKEAIGVNVIADVGTRLVVDFFDKCDEVWAVSESAAETLQNYGYRGEIVVMPNGCAALSESPEDQKRAAERFGLGAEPVFLFVGQQDWKKNIERILLAAAQLKQEGETFKLVLTGDGPHAQEIKDKAGELGLAGCVVFTGHISDGGILSGLYQSADLFVFPSLYDTAGLVVYEAASVGTPSVVIRGSSAAEPIHDGQNGFLCGDNTEDLARVMRLVLTEPDKLRRIGEEARRTIPKSWEGIIDTAQERYERLVQMYRNKGKRD